MPKPTFAMSRQWSLIWVITVWAVGPRCKIRQGVAEPFVLVAQRAVLLVKSVYLLRVISAHTERLTSVQTASLPPLPQGVRGDPAKGFADLGAGGQGRALLYTDVFLDELQGLHLELWGVLNRHATPFIH